MPGEDSNEEAMIGQSRADDINFPVLLMWHLNRISLLCSGPYFNSSTYDQAIRMLEIYLKPYHDADYKKAAKGIDDWLKERYDAIDRQVTSNTFGSAIMRAKSSKLTTYLDWKLGFLIELMHRKNLLLMELGELNV